MAYYLTIVDPLQTICHQTPVGLIFQYFTWVVILTFDLTIAQFQLIFEIELEAEHRSSPQKSDSIKVK